MSSRVARRTADGSWNLWSTTSDCPLVARVLRKRVLRKTNNVIGNN